MGEVAFKIITTMFYYSIGALLLVFTVAIAQLGNSIPICDQGYNTIFYITNITLGHPIKVINAPVKHENPLI